MGLSFGYNRAEGEHQYLSGAGAVRHLAVSLGVSNSVWRCGCLEVGCGVSCLSLSRVISAGSQANDVVMASVPPRHRGGN